MQMEYGNAIALTCASLGMLILHCVQDDKIRVVAEPISDISSRLDEFDRPDVRNKEPVIGLDSQRPAVPVAGGACFPPVEAHHRDPLAAEGLLAGGRDAGHVCPLQVGHVAL